MKKILMAFLSGAVVAAPAAVFINLYMSNRMSNIRETVSFYVRPGDTPEDVLDLLEGKDAVSRPSNLAKVFRTKKVAEYIKPGYYVLEKGRPSVYVARMLNNGWQTPVNLTLSGTMRRVGDISRRIACQMAADSASINGLLDDRAFMDSLGFPSGHELSLFIPDTYQVYWTACPREIISRMKKAYDAFWSDDNLRKADSLGLTALEVSTLASIVVAETNFVQEMPLVAGVYLNRLRIGMRLQADPTVAFCFDYRPERILKKHLEADSPYNTYKHPGLPPGPICVPSRESLEAVLNPDCGGGNLYFCANPDFSGKHIFAKTLKEHNVNARAFQNELTRRHREKISSGTI